jgi:uncharacterized protein YceK
MRKVIYIALILALGIGMSGCGHGIKHHFEKVDHTDDVPMP